MSALDKESTTINYAHSLRTLNLRDLHLLMDEFCKSRSQTVRQSFFEGGLEECHKTKRDVFSGIPQPSLDSHGTTNALADIIMRETRVITRLIWENTDGTSMDQPIHLHQWLKNLPKLEVFELFSGAVLNDERVRREVLNCQSLKSLEIFYWPWGVDTDEALSRFLSKISGNGLEKLVIKGAHTCVRDLTLSTLSSCHGSTLTEFEVEQVSEACLSSLAIATNITNLRSCRLDLKWAMYEPSDESFITVPVSEFLGRNQSLERLDIALFGVEKILPPILPSLKLKHLSITDVLDIFLPDSFWEAMHSQSSSIESLILDTPNWYPEFNRVSRTMRNSIRLMHKLKVLAITAFAVGVTDRDVQGITESCPLLEVLELASLSLTDESLDFLGTLRHLRTFVCLY